MRLLNVETRQLEEFFGEHIPPYAILSHTWGKEEVLFQDLVTEDHKRKHGYKKIEGCCQMAARDDLAFAWIDTCCIDKSSSTELSEAINSMYDWYKQAATCYAYLEDVPVGDNPFSDDSAFRKCRWFTRGWTLQELIAPEEVKFYDCQWNFLLRKHREKFNDCILLAQVAHISSNVLLGHILLSVVPAACKFSWAATRHTTRKEDVAYSLLGLLGINMPLLYGEGDRAFVRLQEALIGHSDDISVLTWGYKIPWEVMERKKINLGGAVFATSPMPFLHYPYEQYCLPTRQPKRHTTMTGRGLHIELPLRLVDPKNRVWVAIIEEDRTTNFVEQSGIAIALRKRENDSNVFERLRGFPPIHIESHSSRPAWLSTFSLKMVYLQGVKNDTTINITSFLDDYRILRNPKLWFLVRIGLMRQPYISILLIMRLIQVQSAGFSLSSIYPPIPRYLQIPDHNQGYVSILDELHMSPFYCAGSLNSLFYFVFEHTQDQAIKFVIRIEIEFAAAENVHMRPPPSVVRSFRVRFFQCRLLQCATAIEYAHRLGFARKANKRLGRRTKWQDEVEFKHPGTQETYSVSASPRQWKWDKMLPISPIKCDLDLTRRPNNTKEPA